MVSTPHGGLVGGRHDSRAPTSSRQWLALVCVAAFAAIAFAAPARADDGLQSSGGPPLRNDRSVPVVVFDDDAAPVAGAAVSPAGVAVSTTVAPNVAPAVEVTTQPAESPANEPSGAIVSADDSLSPRAAETQLAAISAVPPVRSIPPAEVVRTSRRSSHPPSSPGQYHRVAPQYQPSSRRRAKVDRVPRLEADPPTATSSADSSGDSSAGGASDGLNYGSNCADIPAVRLPICADEGADNAGWNCEWIEDCSSETPTGTVVPTQPDCALSSPGAGQYQQADGQYQDDADPCATAQGDESDPNRSAQPAPGDCTERPAGSAATDTPSAGAPPAAAVEPETQPVEQPTTPPEQSSTTPAAGRPHGASDGRAKTPLTPPDGETSADREGWSQLRGRASATVAVSVSPPPVAGRTETVQPQRAVRTSASVPVPQSPAGASYRPHEFRVALAPPLADLSQARASASRAAPSLDRASLLFWAMFIAGVAALGLSTAGALRASGPALMVELSARLRSKGLSRPATRRRAAKHGSANGIRYRD
jgi:hypothetical protein